MFSFAALKHLLEPTYFAVISSIAKRAYTSVCVNAICARSSIIARITDTIIDVYRYKHFVSNTCSILI